MVVTGERVAQGARCRVYIGCTEPWAPNQLAVSARTPWWEMSPGINLVVAATNRVKAGGTRTVASYCTVPLYAAHIDRFSPGLDTRSTARSMLRDKLGNMRSTVQDTNGWCGRSNGWSTGVPTLEIWSHDRCSETEFPGMRSRFRRDERHKPGGIITSSQLESARFASCRGS